MIVLREQVERSGADIYVEVDELRMGQVVANLLTNASKYSDQGAFIWVTIEVADYAQEVSIPGQARPGRWRGRGRAPPARGF